MDLCVSVTCGAGLIRVRDAAGLALVELLVLMVLVEVAPFAALDW